MPTVAYLGPEKTNTYFAARKKFGTKARYLHAPTVEDVFRMVERRRAAFGVIPVENSLEGTVTHTLDRFMNVKASPAKICGEVDLPIEHYLITRPGGKARVIFSHPQALGQCREWLLKRYPAATRWEVASTAEAVNRLLDPRLPSGRGDAWPLGERAAVARRELAVEHGLKAARIPLGRENRTRFLVLSLKAPKRAGRNKTSLMFALKDKPGALHDALVPFKTCGINLTKIESRPTKRKAWEYVFFVDFEGHESEAKAKKVLKELKRSTADLRVLGSYPVGSRS